MPQPPKSTFLLQICFFNIVNERIKNKMCIFVAVGLKTVVQQANYLIYIIYLFIYLKTK